MNNIELQAFYADTLRLVRSIVVKIETVAERDNIELAKNGYPVSSDRRTWRYYMNLNGDYHPTDEMMHVNSIDTGEEIEFTKANLELHRATYREYARDGYWFNRLEERYPAQTDLIRGILSPIKYEESIQAEDYKILRWNHDLVLWNEDQLIPELQRWINAEVPQTFETEYIHTDNLVLPMMVMNLTAGLIQAIHSIRVEAIGTRYAHAFYIWSKIDSYGGYSPYKQSLDRYQTMWLYRNIVWLTNNPGKQYTFGLLLDNLLTHSSIPLAKYDLVENTKDQLENFTPDPTYRKLNLNLINEYGRAPSYITTPELIQKQVSQAKENQDRKLEWLDDAEYRGKISVHSELPTKALESKMADFTNRHLDTIMSVMRNEWIYLTSIGIYDASILITNPKNGQQTRVGSKETYHMWYWMIMKSREGIELEKICPIYYQRAMKTVNPSVDEIRGIGWPEYVTEPDAMGIREQFVPISRIVSPERLKDYSMDVYNAMWSHKKLYSQYYDLTKRSRTKNACDYMYVSGETTLGDDKFYKDIFDRHEIDYLDFSRDEAADFAWAMFKDIVGWEFVNSVSLRAKQSDLIDIMLKLSSFTIHVIKEMEDDRGVMELPNETFIGDSSLIGDGNSMVGDFSGIMFDNKGQLDAHHGLEMQGRITTVNTIEVDASSDGFMSIIDRGGFKPYQVVKPLIELAVQITQRGHFKEFDILEGKLFVVDDDVYLGLLPKE